MEQKTIEHVLPRLLSATTNAIDPNQFERSDQNKTMPRSKVQQRLRLPRELNYELILWLPSTDSRARRLLISNSLLFHFITGSKNGKNWKRPLTVWAIDADLLNSRYFLRVLVPRIHQAPQTLAQVFATIFDYSTSAPHAIFYVAMAIDPALCTGDQTIIKSRNALAKAISKKMAGISFGTAKFVALPDMNYDVVELRYDPPVSSDNEFLRQAVHRAMVQLSMALEDAAKGFFNFLF
ncbi:hypothetical protein niasHT_032618 [Heterodera trifolii]|uniref:Uncharacterized protein n=1 Tax=Heterodera trifolii TaxID=157864 RepID=A0ABD2IA56_9BILA